MPLSSGDSDMTVFRAGWRYYQLKRTTEAFSQPPF
jgi:hypothetical protein